MLDQLLDAWAGSSNYQHFVKRLDSSEIDGRSVDFQINYVPDSAETTSGSGFYSADGSTATFSGALLDGSELAVGRFADDQTLETMAKIKVLEVFNHQDFFNFDFGASEETTMLSMTSGRISTSFSAAFALGDVIVTNEMFSFQQGQVDLIDAAYEKLKSSVYNALTVQTRYKDLVDAVELKTDASGALAFDFRQLNTKWGERLQTGGSEAALDFFEFMGARGSIFVEKGWEWGQQTTIGLLAGMSFEKRTEAAQLFELASFSSSVMGVGSASNEYLYGKEGADILEGGDGADRVYAGAGNDTLAGGVGDDLDYLYGQDGDDLLISGTGGDILQGDNGNDTLVAGSGNDQLLGGAGSDQYHFNSDRSWQSTVKADSSNGNTADAAYFTGYTSSELWFEQSGSDLTVGVIGKEGSAKFEGWYSSESNRVGEIYADDGKLLSSQVDQLVSAMASFSPPVGIGGLLNDEMRESVQPVIAGAWQAA